MVTKANFVKDLGERAKNCSFMNTKDDKIESQYHFITLYKLT